MRKLFLLMLLISSAVCLGACAGASGPEPEGPAPVISTPEFELATPDSLLGSLKAASYTEYDLIKLGRDYDPGFPHANVNTNGSLAEFQGSGWAPGQGTDGLAYCMYGFAVPDYDRAAEINTEWSVEPTDQNSVFYALANWDANRWDWFAGDNPLNVASFDPYFTDDKGDLLLVVAVIDSGAPVLDKIQLGPPPNITDWLHSWGGSDDEQFNAVANDGADEVYCSGITYSYGAGNGDALLFSYSLDGSFLWARAWGGTSNDSYADVAVADDGQVFTVGNTSSYGEGGSDVLIQGWSENGQLTWTRIWGTTDSEQALDLEVSGAILYVLAQTDQAGSGTDLVLFKFDTQAKAILWKKYFGLEFDEGGGALALSHPAPGTDLIHVVFDLGIAASETDVAYCEIDGTGALVSQKQWQNATYEIDVEDLVITDTSQVFITGDAETGSGGRDLLLLEYTTGPSYVATGWAVDDTNQTMGRELSVDMVGDLLVTGREYIGTENPGGLLARFSTAGALLSSMTLRNTVSGGQFFAMTYIPVYGAFVAGDFPDADNASWQSLPLTDRNLSGTWAEALLTFDNVGGVFGPLSEGTLTDLDAEGTHDSGGGFDDCALGLVREP